MALTVSVDEDGVAVVVGLGWVRTVSGVALGTVRARMDPYVSIRGVELADLADRVKLRNSRAGGLRVPRELRAVRLGDVTGQVVLDLLAEDDPDALRLIRIARAEDPGYSAEFAQERAEVRDAISLAAGIAGVPVPSDAFVADRPPAEANDLLSTVLNSAYRADLEEDLLPKDLERFDGQLNLAEIAASASVFHAEKYRLAVFSVNKKSAEVSLGVDLIYWDVTNGSFTLVQYKRLDREKARSGRELDQWVYTREDELRRQLKLMVSNERPDGSSADWRMTQTPYWLKFVRGDAGRSLDSRVLKGMYVPADYLRLAIEEGVLRTGERGGFRAGYDNMKYLTRDAFVELVRRGWTGTRAASSAELQTVISDLSKTGREAVLAVRDLWSAPVVQAAERAVEFADEESDDELPF
ncbi:hypothetical protein [Naasia sp. SYSU D00948]|uniref:hypothetical protein n=1 Tax=Naasia sp. SYSU D00948 TaxID=2817379 RepID=UPI001B302FA3|nr:hypothetical protein [Naasia sp. SYSU D00948]